MAAKTIKKQKIIRVGNSYAITIDREYLEKFSIKAGDTVSVTYYSGVPLIKLEPPENYSNKYSSEKHADIVKEEQLAYISSEITPEFKQWVEKTLEEDKEAMKELSHI